MSVTSTAWMQRAACRTEDPDLFIGPDAEAWHEKAARETKALKVCARCPVTRECGSWMSGDHEWSVAAAMTPEERKAA